MKSFAAPASLLLCCFWLAACASDSRMAIQMKKDPSAKAPQIQTQTGR